LGRVDLALGDPKAAILRLRDLPDRLLAGGFNDPMNPVWEDAIEALVAVGDLERARVYLEQFETSARRLGSPWAEATVCRCRGLLAAAEGDFDASFVAFEQALAHLEARPFPLERGRILLSLGIVRRHAQQRKAAREALAQALAVFDELGARLWAERARAE